MAWARDLGHAYSHDYWNADSNGNCNTYGNRHGNDDDHGKETMTMGIAFGIIIGTTTAHF